MRRKAVLIVTVTMLAPLIASTATCPAARVERFVKPSGKDLYASYNSTDTVALCSKR